MVNNVKKTLSFNKNKETAHKKDMVTIGSRRDMLKKLALTAGLVFLFQALSYVPTPFISHRTLKYIADNNLFGTVSLFSGDSFQNLTLMATGISSYVSASIVMQLLMNWFTGLYDISRSPNGNKIIKRYTIILGVSISLFSSLMITMAQQSELNLMKGFSPYIAFPLTALWHMLGTAIAIWIGETITEKAYGNGISLLILTNVLTRIPNSVQDIFKSKTWFFSLILVLIIFVVVIIVESSYFNIPLIYSKTLARGNNRFTQASSVSVFPIKVNMSGMMPIILAQSILSALSAVFASGFFAFKGNKILEGIAGWFAPSNIYSYSLILIILIILMDKLYSLVMFDPKEIAENLQKSEACVLNVNPGYATVQYLKNTRKKLTVVASLYILLVLLVPTIISTQFHVVLGSLGATSFMLLAGASTELILQISNEFKLNKMKF